jgi:hypothetical protein
MIIEKVEVKEGEREPRIRTELTQDTWGMSILVIVKDLADLCAGQGTLVQAVRCSLGFICSLGNLVLQLTLLVYVKKAVVTPSILDLQRHYKEFHGTVFSAEGKFLQDRWDAWEAKESVCDAAISRPIFLSVVIFLWTASIMGEIRTTVRLVRLIRGMKALPPGGNVADMVEESNEDGQEVADIVCLSGFTRFCLYLLVVIPKFGIALFLLVSGSQWLASTVSFSDLIMNALALQFVLLIDEYLYNAFFPPSVTTALQTTRFAVAGVESTDEEAVAAKIVSEFNRSLFYFALIILWVVLYVFVICDVLPNYQFDIAVHCVQFITERFQPICPPNDYSCFPEGKLDPRFAAVSD